MGLKTGRRERMANLDTSILAPLKTASDAEFPRLKQHLQREWMTAGVPLGLAALAIAAETEECL
jgi:hypothetical protein